MENPIHHNSKIIFTSPEHATETQKALLCRGFKFYSDNQHPRPNAYGAMWKNGEIRTAANHYAFKGYGVPLVNAMELPPRIDGQERKPRPKPITKEERQAIMSKVTRARLESVNDKVIKLVHIVLVALENIGSHEHNLYGTNSRCRARLSAWDALYKECVKMCPEKTRENVLRTAIRNVLGQKGKPFMMPCSRRTGPIMRGE